MRWDFEFSLALYNRTGKFFIARDIIADQAERLEHVFYWRLPLKTPPTGIAAKLLGRALTWDQRLQSRGALKPAMAFRPHNSLLHLDPFTVLHCDLRPTDAVVCHDLGPITHPDLFSEPVVALYKAAYATIARVRPKMVFVSNASADAYAEAYGPLPDARTIYPPVRMDFASGTPTPVADVQPPFLLTVGSLGRRKNQLRAVEAFARSGLAGRGFSYILCGSREPGWNEVVERAGEVPGVRVLPYVSEGELQWLYENAFGFVLMSLLEGFGLPVAEAISHNLVPVISKRSVLEEVAGEGALLADPLDTDSITQALLSLAAMPSDERQQRQKTLAASVRRFTRDAFRQGWQAMLEGQAP